MKIHSENNEKNQEPGPTESGDKGSGKNSTDTGNVKALTHQGTVRHLIERATALRGQSIAHTKSPHSMKRRQTQHDIYGKDPEIPYVKFEKTTRDLICSLLERQERMNEEIFLKINDLEYRVNDFENDQSGKRGGK
jgi:hypothetical protein